MNVDDDLTVEEAGEFTLNAWSGGDAPVVGRFAPDLHEFASQPMRRPYLDLLYDRPLPDWADWQSPAVGWTLVLRLDPSKSPDEMATPADAPEAIQRLWEHRGRPAVLRFVDGCGERADYLRRYGRDEKGCIQQQDLQLSLSTVGEGINHVPYYLLIYGSPGEIPWSVQYILNGTRAVGRLDLTEDEGLSHYVDRLIDGWNGSSATIARALTWSVDQRGRSRDITQIMHDFLAVPFDDKLRTDSTVTSRVFLERQEATGPALYEAMEQLRPGVIVTTSHGATESSAPPDQRRATLGIPVDQAWKTLSVADLLARWEPDGAIWYAHACCSAGGDRGERFADLLDPNSAAAASIAAVAELGEVVAPLPRRLLGSSRPLRAFIGHVGPTFSWTLREPETRQNLTGCLLDALYHHLYQQRPLPVGYAFRPCFAPIGSLVSEHDRSLREHRRRPDATRSPIVRSRLMAGDLQSLVILGDPTALRPPG